MGYYLLKNIRTPINELIRATKQFEEGDMNVRSKNDSTNEFGVLSASFNSMVDNIQTNADLDVKISNLSHIMLSEEDPRTFFKMMLSELCKSINAQMAAVYLLSNDKKLFAHYESIGMDDSTKIEFSAESLEGEFGSVISSRKIQFIKKIPIDTRFVFQTVSGKFIPREIVTIPILAGKEITAIISIASVRSFTEQSVLLMENLLPTLNARVEGILAYRKIKNFSEKLKLQNIELESQTSELEAQSAEMYEQNRELEMQKNQLHEASKLKTNFLSNMSHELRTPLNSVIALSGVLNRRLKLSIPEEEYSYLEVIERNGKHLLSLINDILDISRIESGREETEITKFNVNSLISEIVSMIQPQASQNDIQLINLSSDNELLIVSDSTKCRHILQNLIANAVKFTEKGKVEISAKRSGESIVIQVVDTGIGISKEHLPHIFDEFRQADGSTSRRFGGTGLGLAIAKKYAHFLGGNIEVESTIDVGSCFSLSLPISYSVENKIVEPEVISKFAKPVQSKSLKTNTIKTILLVEDSEPAIIQLKDFMEESGYKIMVAQNGGEALEIIEKIIPDAMILDLMMPDIDGFKVLESLRNVERTAHIPVLILTAKQITKDDLKSLKRNNIHQLIQKGDVNRSELLDAVSSMVNNVEMLEETEIQPQRELQIIKGKPKILVVEDNPDNMITIKAVLGDKFDIIEATDGIEGIAMAAKHKPNLVLMDIALPGMDGIEAFHNIRKNVKLQHIPIIAITASAMTSERETILSHGFDGYIAKPIDESLFFGTVNKVLFG
jgi:signal transduction histidine kinase/DNA-binding response OmpR family regulator/HAMP domain-containing protein